MERNQYLNKWFTLAVDGIVRRAQVIDIEFETGVGPLFLMRTARGHTFWLNRKEIDENVVPKNSGKNGYITVFDELN